MLEDKFRLLNSCTILKRNGIQNTFAKPASQRTFFCNDERFLFMAPLCSEVSLDNPSLLKRNVHRHAEGMCLARAMAPIIDYLRGELQRSGKTVADVCKYFDMHVPGHWFTKASQWLLPTPAHYKRLRAFLNSSGNDEYLRKDYEELRKDYEELRRPFCMEGRQNDVFEISTDGGASSRYGHPTVKDLKLIRSIVRQVTRPDDIICDPFLGSGTTAVAAIMEGRRYIGCELNPDYYEIAVNRIADAHPDSLFRR